MLVLSRRESEKVLFPNLGITVEVSRILGKTVRIGIDAPDEIRVIRGELGSTADVKVRPKSRSNKPKTYKKSSLAKMDPQPDSVEIRKCLDAANLAIHLAQNQLQQELTDRAEEALDQAILCLQELESVVLGTNTAKATSVNESAIGYQIAGHLSNSQDIALIVDDSDRNTIPRIQAVFDKLKSLGYKTISVATSKDLIEFLKQNEQPSLVVTQIAGSQSSQDQISRLRMFGVGSLQKSKLSLEFASSKLTCWFGNPKDEKVFSGLVSLPT